ncbi:MAG TPA: tetratricopeptide repeat protein [Paludibaculum sp.]|jgi:tetratricopeptide (TPR) repeat protein
MVALRLRLILVLAALLAFGGALWAPFQFDDFSLFSDPALTSPEGWRQALSPTQTRPLTWLSEWAQLQVAAEPWSFHLVNLLLHLLCVWLAYTVLLELLPVRSAQIAAMIFAVHPLQTEAVVYVFARGTLLATLLALLAIHLWLKDRRWWAVGAFALALLAKEEVAALPLLLALLEWSTKRRRAVAMPLCAMLALALAAGARVIYAAGAIAGSGAGAHAGIGPFEYFSYQGVAILRYLWLLLAPLQFTVDPDVRVAPLPASLAWGVIAVVAILSWRTVRAAGTGFWILGGLLLLLPSSSIFPAQDLAADRRMYLPLLCFASLAGLLLKRTDLRLLGFIGAILIALSAAQTRVWQNPATLWMDAARHAPDKIRPKRQLARVASPPQAVELLTAAKRLAPNDSEVAADLGLAFIRDGKPELALTEFGRALALDPGSARAMHNRGLALLLLGQTDPARADFERALEKDPCLFDALWNLRRMGVRRELPSGCRATPQQKRLWREPVTSLAP